MRKIKDVKVGEWFRFPGKKSVYQKNLITEDGKILIISYLGNYKYIDPETEVEEVDEDDNFFV